MTTWCYAFGHDHEVEGDDLTTLLGGKGAGLAAMTQAGIPVPPGFTIPTSACLAYLAGGWTPDLTQAIDDGIAGIEATIGRRVGDPSSPLLLSVRSGAKYSMPGMMDTVLNAGMTVDVARAMATLTGDADFAWDTYRRAVVSYAHVVLGASMSEVNALADLHAPAGEAAALAFGRAVAEAGYPVPPDPAAQVRAAVEAVFSSWNSDRATAYREREGIDHELGTAATVQAMVFGNMGERSGTGVAFSRCPSTGADGLMGDFLIGAQGEDVVAGTHQTMPLVELADRWPEIWAELEQVASTLEHQHSDMVDLEFTIEQGRLWLLQTRTAKRSPAAVFRAAVAMANDPDFPVDRAEAVRRCGDHLENPPRIPAPAGGGGTDDGGGEVVLATGLAASPGRAVGVVSLDPDDAVEREANGEAVILVRQETSPADVHGMGASVGLVTTLGGMVSHAAVVARSWGLAAVVGCDGIDLAPDAMVCGDRRIAPGTVITVDGDGGRVLLGEHRSESAPLPEVDTIRGWARALSEGAGTAGTAGDDGTGVPSADEATTTSAASGGAVDPEACLRLIVLKGMANAEGLSEPLGASEPAVAEVLQRLEGEGLIAELNAGRMRPTPEGAAQVQALVEAEMAQHRALCDQALDRFHEPNMLLKQVVTAWQMKTVDGQEAMNDHDDPAYDAAIIERLRHEVHTPVLPIVADLGAALPRLARYRERLEASLTKLAADDHRYMAHPLLDSYHTIWFELHEELIRLAGRDRASETAAGRA